VTKEERKRIADAAIHTALTNEILANRKWSIVGCEMCVFLEPLPGGGHSSTPVATKIAALMAEVLEWRSRASQHGCNVIEGDGECG